MKELVRRLKVKSQTVYLSTAQTPFNLILSFHHHHHHYHHRQHIFTIQLKQHNSKLRILHPLTHQPKMCKVRRIHFTSHDVRARVATNPFTALGGPDEFISTQPKNCHCRGGLIKPLLQANAASVSASHFRECAYHQCCVLWSSPQVLCQWPGQIPDVEGAADCPNYREDNEYWPIEMVLNTSGWDRQAGVCGSEGWKQTGEETPMFPAEELFYSDDILEGDAGVPESEGLESDRGMAEYYGERLQAIKVKLQRVILKSETKIARLEWILGTDPGHEWASANPYAFRWDVGFAKSWILDVYNVEQEAAAAFRLMMKFTGFVLTVLDRMPAKKESITTADGSYTISREQLDIGDLEAPSAVRDACDGPLKQAENLQRRYREIALQILKADPDSLQFVQSLGVSWPQDMSWQW